MQTNDNKNQGLYNKKCQERKLLGANIDSNFSFNNHITDLCCEVSQNNNALPRTASFILKMQNICNLIG